jgi:hypothetical protein
MKTAAAIGIGLFMACYLYFGTFSLHNIYAEKKVKPAKPSTSMLVKCKDGSEYLDSLTSTKPFKCSWKELQFNF